ncbi:MAG TPA: hemerythrin domain-containing protein [Candidatus Kryptonia bacterium]
MYYSRMPSQPIDVLKWEHELILSRLDDLLSRASEAPCVKTFMIRSQTGRLLKLQELHQEAEERFLFPLMSEVDESLISSLRVEHASLFRSSDVIQSTATTHEIKELVPVLMSLKDELKKHFEKEESKIFENAQIILTPAKSDILKIKFATRNLAII